MLYLGVIVSILRDAQPDLRARFGGECYAPTRRRINLEYHTRELTSQFMRSR